MTNPLDRRTQLRSLLDRCARRWSLTLLSPYANLSYSYVAPVVRADGTPAVLKVARPGMELHTEIAALRLFDGRNSVRLLDVDPLEGVLLLEKLCPGPPLTTLAGDAGDATATSVAASVMRGLWRPLPCDHSFPTIEDWGAGFHRMREHSRNSAALPLRIVDRAVNLFEELAGSMSPPVVLHGDLHHDNILMAERDPWLSIDPKGVVGEPAYEVGALLRNLWPDRHSLGNPQRTLERRVWQLAEELDLERSRVRGWGLAQAVLSAWWCIEDGEDCCDSSLAVAELLSRVKV